MVYRVNWSVYHMRGRVGLDDETELLAPVDDRNILGLKGPRKIRVLLPTVGFKDGQRLRIPREQVRNRRRD